MSHSTCAPARPMCVARALSNPISTLAAGAGIIFYFYYFAVSGLLAGFTHDDLMNLTVAWRPAAADHIRDTILFFRPGVSYRPVGSLFYRGLYEMFGFHPMPYRVACYALLMANLWLAWQVALHLTRSRRQAFLVTILYSYHGALWPLYLSTGFCYDLLCFFFYGAAMTYYLRLRRHALLGGREMAIWAALYVLSLGSKEIAVSLPVVTLAYELLRNPPRGWCWLWREGRMALLGGAITVAYLAGRMTGPDALSNIDAYRIDLRPQVFADRALHLLAEAFYDPRPQQMVALVVLLIGLPLVCRAKPLRLALVWMVAGILPIAFIAPRGLAQAYVPGFGLALFAASAVNILLKNLPPTSRRVAVFALIPTILVIYHSRNGQLDHLLAAGEAGQIQAAYDQLQALNPSYPPAARVLLVQDAFPENDWASTFLIYLQSGRRDAVVGRAKLWMEWSRPDERLSFDVVLSYNQGKMLQCNERRYRNIAASDLPTTPCEPVGIAYP